MLCGTLLLSFFVVFSPIIEFSSRWSLEFSVPMPTTAAGQQSSVSPLLAAQAGHSSVSNRILAHLHPPPLRTAHIRACQGLRFGTLGSARLFGSYVNAMLGMDFKIAFFILLAPWTLLSARAVIPETTDV